MLFRGQGSAGGAGLVRPGGLGSARRSAAARASWSSSSSSSSIRPLVSALKMRSARPLPRASSGSFLAPKSSTMMPHDDDQLGRAEAGQERNDEQVGHGGSCYAVDLSGSWQIAPDRLGRVVVERQRRRGGARDLRRAARPARPPSADGARRSASRTSHRGSPTRSVASRRPSAQLLDGVDRVVVGDPAGVAARGGAPPPRRPDRARRVRRRGRAASGRAPAAGSSTISTACIRSSRNSRRASARWHHASR